MKDKLVAVKGDDGAYAIQWVIAGDEWDSGAYLGDGEDMDMLREKIKTGNKEEREHALANIAVYDNRLSDERDGNGIFLFYSKKKANIALKAAKEAIKNNELATPWPQWAISAVENGWTPPKKWTP